MLNREYINDIGKSELILADSDQTEFPVYYEKMLFYNKLPNALPFVSERNNGEVQFRFATDGRRPFTEVCEEKKPDGQKLRQLLLGVIRAITQASEYLMDEKDFVIRADCIFEDANGEPAICCLPGYGQPLREQFSELFEFLMNRLDYNDKRAVVTLYELYRRVKETVVSFEDMRSVIEKNMNLSGITGLPLITESPQNSLENADELRRDKHTPAASDVVEIVGNAGNAEKRNKKGLINSLLGKQSSGAGEKTSGKSAPSAGEKTTLLFSPPENSEFYLASEDGKQIINISKFPFFIGKRGANNDAELTFPQISRLHAKLTKDENNIIYLTDLQSLNGCFVNGTRLNPGEQVAVKENDSVRLANISYKLQQRYRE